MILVTEDAKKVMTLAEVACFAAQTMGITTLNLVEHTMVQKAEASSVLGLSFYSQASTGEAKNFRYDVSPKSKVSTFAPKLQSGADPMALRATMFGALFENLLTVPKSAMGTTLWEAEPDVVFMRSCCILCYIYIIYTVVYILPLCR